MKAKLLLQVCSIGLTLISCSNTWEKPSKLESSSPKLDSGEVYRPLFHYTPKMNWMNDPNGMFYSNGKYHLYYQYYPNGNQWGPMHWGHASTENLVTWKEHDIALYPDSALGYIFSGSAILDSSNKSGLGSKQHPPLIAMYTHHNSETQEQYQSISYSLDGGMTFIQYENNPVITNPGLEHFRDPKIVWDDNQWVCVVTQGQSLAFYGSEDLLNWNKLSEFTHSKGSLTGVWECPELMFFRGEQNDAVLLVSVGDGAPNGGSGTQYFTGTWDGSKFSTPQKELKWFDFGRDNYAGVTWHNAPMPANSKLFIGWMSNWAYATKVPTFKWRSSMTLPRIVEYVKIGEHSYLCQKPHGNLANLRRSQHSIESSQKIEGRNTHEWLFDGAENWALTFYNSKGDSLKLYSTSDSIYIDRSLSGKVSFDAGFKELQVAPKVKYKDQSIRLVMDVTSLELFCEGGLTTMTSLFFPNEPFTSVISTGIEGTYYYLGESQPYEE
jgi:fructan beta-fructosidase